MDNPYTLRCRWWTIPTLSDVAGGQWTIRTLSDVTGGQATIQSPHSRCHWWTMENHHTLRCRWWTVDPTLSDVAHTYLYVDTVSVQSGHPQKVYLKF